MLSDRICIRHAKAAIIKSSYDRENSHSKTPLFQYEKGDSLTSRWWISVFLIYQCLSHMRWWTSVFLTYDLFQVHFGSRTVVHLFVDVDICDAAAQSLAMTNIASFSLVDADARRIRISFQVLGTNTKIPI